MTPELRISTAPLEDCPRYSTSCGGGVGMGMGMLDYPTTPSSSSSSSAEGCYPWSSGCSSSAGESSACASSASACRPTASSAFSSSYSSSSSSSPSSCPAYTSIFRDYTFPPLPLSLDPDSARLYVAQALDLNITFSLLKTGFLSRETKVELDRRATLVAEEKRRREISRKEILQGEEGLPGYYDTAHYDRERDTLFQSSAQAAAAAAAAASSTIRPMTSSSSSSSSRHARSHSLALSSMLLPKRVKKTLDSRQRRKIEANHRAWNALGVDSRRILREVGMFPGFDDVPRLES